MTDRNLDNTTGVRMALTYVLPRSTLRQRWLLQPYAMGLGQAGDTTW